MSIDLNTLAKRTLIACDDAYFANVDKVRPVGDIDPTHRYIDDALTPLNDTPGTNYQAQYISGSLTQGYVVRDEINTPTTGFKCIAFQNSSSNDFILAFGGTDGPDGIDWKANLFSYGYQEWAENRATVFRF